MAWDNPSLQPVVVREPRDWKVFGIPIHVNPSWLIIVGLLTWTLADDYFPFRSPGFAPGIYWAVGALAAVLLFVCVLLHEMGHSLVAKAYGIPVARITLFIFGGVAQISHEPKRPSVELLVALAGPLVSVCIAGSCILALRALSMPPKAAALIAAVLRYLATVNIGLIVFNLLPGFPLDGGRVLRAILWKWTGSLRRATRIASFIGAVLGTALLIFGLWIGLVKGFWGTGGWYLLLGWYLRDAAMMSYRYAAR